jgi:hypothetical protein
MASSWNFMATIRGERFFTTRREAGMSVEVSSRLWSVS